MSAIPKQQQEPTYNMETLANEYSKANIQPKKKEHLLLDHTNPIWKWLFPVIMITVGAIICWVGGYE